MDAQFQALALAAMNTLGDPKAAPNDVRLAGEDIVFASLSGATPDPGFDLRTFWNNWKRIEDGVRNITPTTG